MKNINLHIYPSNMTNESRIFKESKFISKNIDFDEIILLGIWQKGLKQNEFLEKNIKIKRISLFNIQKRVIQYLYYFLYVTVFIFINRPKMINIHTLEFLPLVLISKIFNIKVIYDTHELETEKANLKGYRKSFSMIIEKTFIKYCDKIIVVGDAIADEYKKMYPNIQKTYVVLNTPPYRTIEKKNIFREKFNINEKQLIFLYQGAITYSRGIEKLIEVFKTMDNKIVFMGYGPLVSEVKNQSLKFQNIFYHEAVSPDVLLDYTSSADVGFCLIENSCKSYDYCMPNKMFEYIMAEIPVIVSNLHEMTKFVNKNKIGVIVDYNDIESIKKVVESFDKNNLSEYIDNIKISKRKINWEEQEKVLKNVYEELF